MVGDPRAIGVFDSGVGGLTVVGAMLDLLPGEAVLYYGDTARSPYGPRPVTEIRSFAREIAGFLLERDVKALVVACNSIEVAAIADLTERAGTPVVGVIEPGVRAALRVTRTGRIGVIGTEATIASGAYERALRRHDPGARLVPAACPAFVPHVERGETDGPELEDLATGYLAPLLAEGIDSLILGCTHYPLIADVLGRVAGPEVSLISSARQTARDVAAMLAESGTARGDDGPVQHELLSSGDAEAFRALAGRFLGPRADSMRVAEVRGVPAWS